MAMSKWTKVLLAAVIIIVIFLVAWYMNLIPGLGRLV